MTDDDIDAIHTCDDDDCPVRGLSTRNAAQLGHALKAWIHHRDDIKYIIFRDNDGHLNVLLTIDHEDGVAVIGALFMPGMYEHMKDVGFAMQSLKRDDEEDVN